MTKKKILALVMIPPLVLILLVFVRPGIFSMTMFHVMSKNMVKGQEYLYQMDEDELKKLLIDANTFRNDSSLTAIGFGALSLINDNGIPPKYRERGIIRIDVRRNRVSYIWMGGFDHTCLYITFEGDKVIRIGAGYNDHSGQKYYPVLEPVWHDLDYPKMKKIVGNCVIDETRLHFLIDSLEQVWAETPVGIEPVSNE